MEYRDGAIRGVACDGVEVLHRLYFAFRDPNWLTIEGRISDVSVQRGRSSFRLGYRGLVQRDETRFRYEVTIVGNPRGEVVFSVDGTAESSFRRNRIGLCLLHPPDAAGDGVVVTHTDGGRTEGWFPRRISPRQPFMDVRSLRHQRPGGLEVRFDFEGEVFEMEDQRNWTDATFKTYGTPYALPFPVEVGPGTRVRQQVTITVVLPRTAFARSHSPSARARRRAAVVISSAGESGGAQLRMPRIGFSLGDSGEISAQAVSRLRDLAPDFLTVPLNLGDPSWERSLANALWGTEGTGIPLAPTVLMPDAAAYRADALARSLESCRSRLSHLTVLSDRALVSRPEDLQAVRAALARQGVSVPMGGGTRAFFAEINRNPLALELVDFVSYTVNPQVHAFDERSIVETLAGQRATVESARAICGALPVHIGMVTLRQQWNPNATAPARRPAEGELPDEVDARQRLPFAAAWTVGCIKALAETGAASATFYELEGARGLMERASGSEYPVQFPSAPSELFPLFHVFRALRKTGGLPVIPAASSAPPEVEMLAVQSGGGLTGFLCNYTAEPLAVRLQGFTPLGAPTPVVPPEPRTDPFASRAADSPQEVLLAPESVTSVGLAAGVFGRES